ncbi:hypothetical protein NL676_031622 [Syzygium grande]|nr:hypothetical protein NL676_031622 [Syzygium grande]
MSKWVKVAIGVAILLLCCILYIFLKWYEKETNPSSPSYGKPAPTMLSPAKPPERRLRRLQQPQAFAVKTRSLRCRPNNAKVFVHRVHTVEGSIRRSADFAPTARPRSKASSILGFLLCFISFELTQLLFFTSLSFLSPLQPDHPALPLAQPRARLVVG